VRFPASSHGSDVSWHRSVKELSLTNCGIWDNISSSVIRWSGLSSDAMLARTIHLSALRSVPDKNARNET